MIEDAERIAAAFQEAAHVVVGNALGLQTGAAHISADGNVSPMRISRT